MTPVGKCTGRISIGDATFVGTFVVLAECCRELILGMDFLREYNAVIDVRERLITLSPSPRLPERQECRSSLRVIDDDVNIPPRSCMLVSVNCDVRSTVDGIAERVDALLCSRGVAVARGVLHLVDGKAELLLTNFSNEHQHVAKHTAVAFFEDIPGGDEDCFALQGAPPGESSPVPAIDVNPSLPFTQCQELRELLMKFMDCFSATSAVRQTPLTKHRIITDDAVRPLRQNPYRVSTKEREAIRSQVEQIMQDHVIQPYRSPWASPVVLVKKKDGTLRFCVDYRKLNQVTKKDVYPLPRIDGSLYWLRHARYFSSMDLKSGYWQIEVDERDSEKTAFITPDGLFEFKVLPFGLCSAPGTFQRMMDTVLSGLKWQTCLVYLDDVIVFSSTFEEHVKLLSSVLRAVRAAALTLKAEKCHFGYEKLRFLGHVVSNAGVTPDPEKVAAISNCPTPKDKRALR